MLGSLPERQVSNLSFVRSETKEDFISVLGQGRRKESKDSGLLRQERWRIDIQGSVQSSRALIPGLGYMRCLAVRKGLG